MLERLFKSVVSSKVITQAMLDEHRAGVLLKLWENHHSIPNYNITDEEYDKVNDSFIAKTEQERKKYVAESLNKQTISLFTHVHKAFNGSKSSYPQSAIDHDKLMNSLKESAGYALEVGQSKLEDAGKGVFVRSKAQIMPGTVVAFYPGLVHLKEYMRTRKDIDTLKPDHDLFLMFRTDGVIIDGRTVDKVPYNPYAQAHLINHVGSGMSANVIQILYDFPGTTATTGFPEHLQPYIPNIYARQPSFLGSSNRVVMSTIAFVSSAFIDDGDELMFDYRLNPASKNMPKWYTPYDVASARRLWLTPAQISQGMASGEVQGNTGPIILRSNYAKPPPSM